VTRLALVVPRYGPDVLGGAETLARDFAGRLPPDEFDVTVLTTCARDLLTWQNEYLAGETEVDGVRVLRFPVDHHRRDARLYQRLNDRANRGEPLSGDEQAVWLEHSAHSPQLYRHLAGRGDEYDILLFLPYLFATTLYGTAIWPGKSVVCPCLHDEPYAYFDDVRAMLASVRGLMFISPAERALAEEKLGVHHPAAKVVGFGLDGFPADGERFRRRFDLSGPFLLYAGRLDPSKNVLQLIGSFMAYRQARPGRNVKLVLAGSGRLPLPDCPEIVPLGFLGVDDLHDAFAAAMVLCQPSLVESFSIVVMESWLAGTPVLVHGHCPVTRHHVLRSNGGLYFTSAAEFAGAVDWFFEHPEDRQRMGMLGRAYVRSEYHWAGVLQRFREALSVWLPENGRR
jgi:glycosyltransferase involved in cell wall biosynthesis